MNGNINDKDAESSFFEEDFEETENARRFVSTCAFYFNLTTMLYFLMYEMYW